jgi:hypothetical protein
MRDVAGRNRKNGSASNIPIVSGCHPASAYHNELVEKWFLFHRRLHGGHPEQSSWSSAACNAAGVTKLKVHLKTARSS